MLSQPHWATIPQKEWKVVVTEHPHLEGKYIGFMLPEWLKDGRKRRRFKKAFYMEFILGKEDVIIGEPVEFSIKTDYRDIYDGPELSGTQWLNVVAREITVTITIDGASRTRVQTRSV